MSDIKPFIYSYLLEPFKNYETDAQYAIIKLIVEKLTELYDYTLKFPEIITPNQYRLDIVRIIADQFLFSIRDEADIQEQLNILDKILYVYSRRGSIDTIENMWKYYGGKLPKDVKVTIPSYNLFRYSVSALSGTHTFQDNESNRTGVYEIRVTNSYYSMADLRKFLIKELVAAGNYIYITNNFHMDLTADSFPWSYEVREDNLINMQMLAFADIKGLVLSSRGKLSNSGVNAYYSGKANIFVDITTLLNLKSVAFSYLTYLNEGFVTLVSRDHLVRYLLRIKIDDLITLNLKSYCTPTDNLAYIMRYLYNRQGEIVEEKYPGFFILKSNLLGEEVI